MHDTHGRTELTTALGVIGALAIAGVLATVDHHIGQTNVALLLVLWVAGTGATGGRIPGAATGAAAALAYNFFHTAPRHSLRIERGSDILTVILLAVVGLAVGELGRRWERSRWQASRADIGLNRVVRVAELAAAGADVDTLASVVSQEIRRELRLRSVRFDLAGLPGEERPVLDHHGVVDQPMHVFVDDGFALPTSGVDLAVTYRGRDFGRLVLIPERPMGLAGSQRRCAVALADQLGAALAASIAVA